MHLSAPLSVTLRVGCKSRSMNFFANKRAIPPILLLFFESVAFMTCSTKIWDTLPPINLCNSQNAQQEGVAGTELRGSLVHLLSGCCLKSNLAIEEKFFVNMARLHPHTYNCHLQRISKELFPGCVKLGEKVAFCLPTAGRRTQFFHPIFTQPGKVILQCNPVSAVKKQSCNKWKTSNQYNG